MKKRPGGRRDFLKTCLAMTAAACGRRSGRLFAGVPRSGVGSDYDAKGLPTRVLGQTGVAVPIIGFGGGSRFCRIEDIDKSRELLNYALDHGLYYWDTAEQYGDNNFRSEERYGLVLKDPRREVFLATKTGERTYEGAMRQLEESLKRLQTDHLDVYQVHSVSSPVDVEAIGAKGGVLEALYKLRD